MNDGTGENTVWLSATDDPGTNLAFEECVLDDGRANAAALIVYENRDAVVIGKNQNPWLECNLPYLLKHEIPLLRRQSGGGTVFHGRGNLNIGVVVPRHDFDKFVHLETLRRAVETLGVACRVTDRGDLYVDRYKVSGNAMCYRKDVVLHHATLLIDADLRHLQHALRAPENRISTHAVASRRAAVANLTDFSSEASVDLLSRRIVSEFRKVYSVARTSRVDGEGGARLSEKLTRHRSWDWVYGRTPRFSHTTVDGTVVSVRHGRVESVEGGPGAGDEALSRFPLGEAFDPYRENGLY